MNADDPGGATQPVGAAVLTFVKRAAAACGWQLLGKAVQVFSAAYAYRCLGPANVGLSGTILSYTALCYTLFDFGLERIAIRRIAAAPADSRPVAAAVFALRVVVAVIALVIWTSVAAAMSRFTFDRITLVWLLGSLYLFIGLAGTNWYFQATDRFPTFTAIQTMVSLVTSLTFLLAFRPGQAPGSDLAVMVIVEGVVLVAVYAWIFRRHDIHPFRLAELASALRYLRESHANWWFSLAYCALSTMTLPICFLVLDEGECGWFRAAAALATSGQMLLNSVGALLNVRIVAWRKASHAKFNRRLALLTWSVLASGLLVTAVTWMVRLPLFRFLYGVAFLPGADSIAPLVAGKFFAMASGVQVWGLLAGHFDRAPVRAIMIPLAASTAIHLILIPMYGATGGAFAYLAGELLLFFACLIVRRITDKP